MTGQLWKIPELDSVGIHFGRWLLHEVSVTAETVCATPYKSVIIVIVVITVIVAIIVTIVIDDNCYIILGHCV